MKTEHVTSNVDRNGKKGPKPALPLTGMRGAKAVQGWNRIVPVGASVNVVMDDGSIKKTKTQSEAFMLGGHTAVIHLEGVSGAYSLARVTMNGEAAA